MESKRVSRCPLCGQAARDMRSMSTTEYGRQEDTCCHAKAGWRLVDKCSNTQNASTGAPSGLPVEA
jgi:hypothetical protein